MTLIEKNSNNTRHIYELENGARYATSYGKPIALINRDGTITLDSRYYDYSVTTAKHRNYFLGIDSKEFNKRNKAGEYQFAILDNL